MHPSPNHLQDMTTTALKAYRAELTELAAEWGYARYDERIAAIDAILAERKASR